MRNSKYALLLAFLLSLSVPPAFALSTQQTPEGVSYISGGIGVDEVNELQQHKDEFNLYLLFSEGERGTAAVGVDIEIYNAKQELVFTLKNAGPRVYVNLPAGEYKVNGVFNSQTQGATFAINGKQSKKVVLYWKKAYGLDPLTVEQMENLEPPQ